MTTRVFVAGIGLISAIGRNVDENLKAITAQVIGLGELEQISTSHQSQFPVCEIKLSNEKLKVLAEAENSRELSRTSLLGLIAAREACRLADLAPRELKNCGLISANSVGGMDRSELFYPAFKQNRSKGRLRDVKGHECGHSTEFIATLLGLGGFLTTISTACSSSANAIMFGARLIKSGRLERVLAGGCDALTRFTINGFSSLKILAHEGCKPFDENRAGLNLGEGAGFLVLESESALLARGKNPICEITGYGNTCDAYHQTASSPDGEGSYQAMTTALKTAGLTCHDIDYINAHGTGTTNNDLSEGIALQRLFSEGLPPVSSTKPYTGHTLGAAGGIEAVLCCLSLREDIVFPNLGWQTPMKELSFLPNQELKKNRRLRHVLSNSFGFGGNDTSLILSRC